EVGNTVLLVNCWIYRVRGWSVQRPRSTNTDPGRANGVWWFVVVTAAEDAVGSVDTYKENHKKNYTAASPRTRRKDNAHQQPRRREAERVVFDMRKAGSSRGVGAASASARNNALIDSGIAVLHRATSMDREGNLEEAFTLYEGGIDLLLQGARQEPSEQRRQTLLREANVHMSRAESIKLALDPRHLPSLSPAPAPEPAPAPTPAPPGVRSRGKGKSALSRPVPTASDVRGNLRGVSAVSNINRGGG
ncbi:unnamed protein product, partial [Pylaiella littoralis]